MNLYCDITLSNDELTAMVSTIQILSSEQLAKVEEYCGDVKLTGLQTKLAEQIQSNIKFLNQIQNEEATETTEEDNQPSGE